ncbi:MAG: 16S rRNA (cytidine(1402)-2'-O)-methyltransferase [Bacteroidales bacterium]|nr:16S rRNA (cytidine(1402)-2'-O)-methyltransferase [Bacteroidales bacterium]
MSSKLYLVPTPIGNLEDITLRAIRILKEADLILAEDTRTSAVLLRHYDIGTRMDSFHKFNEHKKLGHFIGLLKSGSAIALISDAGTPSISDPGFLLVRECIQEQIEVECLPGATAFVPALVNSGFPSERFVFEGFLPQKKGRNKRLEALKEEDRTLIFYESPFRLVKTLVQLADVFSPEHQVCVSRELTKIHEENRRGTLKELSEYYADHPPKGEIVIVFNPRPDSV